MTMTNRELIDHLKQFPLDAEVVYPACSEYWMMDTGEVTFASDGKAVEPYGNIARFVSRGGHVVTYKEKQWDKAVDGEPVFLQLILFPGN